MKSIFLSAIIGEAEGEWKLAGIQQDK